MLQGCGPHPDSRPAQAGIEVICHPEPETIKGVVVRHPDTHPIQGLLHMLLSPANACAPNQAPGRDYFVVITPFIVYLLFELDIDILCTLFATFWTYRLGNCTNCSEHYTSTGEGKCTNCSKHYTSTGELQWTLQGLKVFSSMKAG